MTVAHFEQRFERPPARRRIAPRARVPGRRPRPGGGLGGAPERSVGPPPTNHVQYLRWLGDLMRGDLGVSLRTSEPVTADAWLDPRIRYE
jgi:hypothetical protein